MVLRLLENAFVNQKNKSIHFYLCHQAKISPRFLSLPLQERFLYFFSAEREEDYGAEKITKIKLARVLVTSFDEFHYLSNNNIFGVVPFPVVP